MGQNAEIFYLFHSGFAVKTAAHTMIFDYCLEKPEGSESGLSAGVIHLEELKGQQTVVFASHSHYDHFIPAILEWGREDPALRYVLSYDIRAGRKMERVLSVRANERYDLGDLTVRTLRSTDKGVAFLVEADGLKLYHAGDLNWWHWEGEPEEENETMGANYRKEIDRLEGEAIDIAFVPVDPRLGSQYLWGLSYFMNRTQTSMVFPMHFGDDRSAVDRLFTDPDSEGYRAKVVNISRRGEKFNYVRQTE